MYSCMSTPEAQILKLPKRASIHFFQLTRVRRVKKHRTRDPRYYDVITHTGSTKATHYSLLTYYLLATYSLLTHYLLTTPSIKRVSSVCTKDCEAVSMREILSCMHVLPIPGFDLRTTRVRIQSALFILIQKHSLQATYY